MPASAVSASYDAILSTTNDSAVASVDRWNVRALEVCDEAADSIRAKAQLQNLTTGKVIAKTQNANGSDNDDCGTAYAYTGPMSDQKLRLTVWVQNGPDGDPVRT